MVSQPYNMQAVTYIQKIKLLRHTINENPFDHTSALNTSSSAKSSAALRHRTLMLYLTQDTANNLLMVKSKRL